MSKAGEESDVGIDRRGFLKTLGAAGVGAALVAFWAGKPKA